MDVYKIGTASDLIKGNRYVGRGIVIGMSADGGKACLAYFIMGRSANSRNRILTEKEGELFTEPYDREKVQDPSLIIYRAIRSYGDAIIVTNGDQTDTIYAGLAAGKSFSESLCSRTFEPDRPNYTPRISGILYLGGDFRYEMSILKSADAEGTACNRYTFSYEPLAGVGHFLHTYLTDGDPIPTFTGEPKRIMIPDSIDDFTQELWDALDEENKISLYVRYVDLASGEVEKRLINKNE